MADIDNYKKWIATILIMFFVQNITFGQKPIRLLVRADDMGISFDVNLAVIKAHKEGILTSASIMPGSVFFEEAIQAESVSMQFQMLSVRELRLS